MKEMTTITTIQLTNIKLVDPDKLEKVEVLKKDLEESIRRYLSFLQPDDAKVTCKFFIGDKEL
jgi:hypothetical protein